MKRPLSITIISWFLIITSLLSIATTSMTWDDPEVVALMELNTMPLPVQFAMIVIGTLVMLVAGVLMLKGRNAGRMAYVVWTALSMIVGLFTAPALAMLIPGLLFFLVIVFFLFRSAGNAWFSAGQEVVESDS